METQKLRETFDHYDRDKNGTIDFSEFKELLSVLEAKTDDDSCRLAFGTIDKDGNGTMQFDEFSRWWRENH